MEQRYIVLNSGVGMDIYKFPASQTARIETELSVHGNRFQIFSCLDEAKQAIIGLMDLNGASEPRSTGRFSSAGTDMASQLKAKLLAKTEGDLQSL